MNPFAQPFLQPWWMVFYSSSKALNLTKSPWPLIKSTMNPVSTPNSFKTSFSLHIKHSSISIIQIIWIIFISLQIVRPRSYAILMKSRKQIAKPTTNSWKPSSSHASMSRLILKISWCWKNLYPCSLIWWSNLVSITKRSKKKLKSWISRTWKRWRLAFWRIPNSMWQINFDQR